MTTCHLCSRVFSRIDRRAWMSPSTISAERTTLCIIVRSSKSWLVRSLDNGQHVVRCRDPIWQETDPRWLHHPREWFRSGSLASSIPSLTGFVELPLEWALRNPEAAIPVICCSRTPGSALLSSVTAFLGNWSETGRLPFRDGVEELTPVHPSTSEDLLDQIKRRSMSCLKLVSGDEDLDSAEPDALSGTYQCLRYLKIDGSSLPLQDKLIRQILNSSASDQRQGSGLTRRWFGVFYPNSVGVLHSHTLDLRNAEELNSFLEAEIDNMNLTRRHNPLRLMIPNALGRDSNQGHNMTQDYSGPDLCRLPRRSMSEF